MNYISEVIFSTNFLQKQTNKQKNAFYISSCYTGHSSSVISKHELWTIMRNDTWAEIIFRYNRSNWKQQRKLQVNSKCFSKPKKTKVLIKNLTVSVSNYFKKSLPNSKLQMRLEFWRLWLRLTLNNSSINLSTLEIHITHVYNLYMYIYICKQYIQKTDT